MSVPFIRQTRDKRGFEQTYVMHAGRPGAGQQRPRVLYVFRTPANLRVGRRALEGEVREALEHTHPDLSFDWNALSRDAIVVRPEPTAQRGAKPPRPRPGGSPPAPPPAIQMEDESLLGRTLGASHAARLRARFSEVTQRIGRRARTPEERDALLERARPLNPDGWPDEDAIRARSATADSELNALAAELPSRRRGRRGGRNRNEPAPGTPRPSGIMAGDDQRNEDPDPSQPDRAPDRDGDAGRDDDVGPADPEAGISGDN